MSHKKVAISYKVLKSRACKDKVPLGGAMACEGINFATTRYHLQEVSILKNGAEISKDLSYGRSCYLYVKIKHQTFMTKRHRL